jgi:nucleotidyltransferase/DNA polymerase involved in DNA repair
MPGFCRDCRHDARETVGRCDACGSPRLVRHGELDALAVAHVDCDAFYATIEKRDDPTLADQPVIVGGRRRGVVLTACYIARTYGVRSAMPMFEARRLCPHAAVVPPDMEKYARVGREVRGLMRDLTPLVEPVSIDEAFMDLSAPRACMACRRRNRSPPSLSGSSATSASQCRSGLPATSSWPRSPPTSTSRADLPCSAPPRRRRSWRRGR